MVSTRNKIIKGITYLYAEYSFRLPNGKIKKLSKIIKKKEEASSKLILNYFIQEEIRLNQDFILQNYASNVVFTEEQFKKIEQSRVEYKYLTRKLSKNQLQDVINRFAVNFTYESNALEGNSLTLKDVTSLFTEERLPKNKDLREVYETRNMRKAIQMLFEKKIKLTKKSIINMHKVIVQDTDVRTGFKKIPNFLLMRDLKTTLPEKVEEEIDSLLDWFHKTKDYPLKKAIKFHALFERIHPFEDGNGRVGRIILNAILLQANYPPIIIRKTSRIAYFESLAAYDKGYKTKLERFILKKYKQTFEKFFKIYIEYL